MTAARSAVICRFLPLKRQGGGFEGRSKSVTRAYRLLPSARRVFARNQSEITRYLLATKQTGSHRPSSARKPAP
jgi:hypothetical protein